MYMSIHEYTTPHKLERYSFLWSEARLIIAAIALFLGGIPPVLFLVPFPAFFGLVRLLLTLSWIISGLASLYLLFRWNKDRTLFGAKRELDMWSFFVMTVSGLNLGLAGIFGRNIGMSLSSSHGIFILVGILYLASLYHLNKRWKENGKKIF